MIHVLWIVLLFACSAQAQTIPPVQPQFGLQALVTLEIRLKGAAVVGSTTPPTVRLAKWQPATMDARTFTFTQFCWNTKSSCPQVASATVRVYLHLPWLPNVNVTRFVLCNAPECTLPTFAPLVAKPGEAYRFSYDRVTAQWVTPPGIVKQPGSVK